MKALLKYLFRFLVGAYAFIAPILAFMFLYTGFTQILYWRVIIGGVLLYLDYKAVTWLGWV